MPSLTEMLCGAAILLSSFGIVYLLNDGFKTFVDREVTPTAQEWTTDQRLPTWADFRRGFDEGRRSP